MWHAVRIVLVQLEALLDVGVLVDDRASSGAKSAMKVRKSSASFFSSLFSPAAGRQRAAGAWSRGDHALDGREVELEAG